MKLDKKSFSVSRLTILLIGLVTFWTASNLHFGKDFWKDVVLVDGKGYYAYLPATFIYHDPQFSFADVIEKQKYPDPQHYYDYRITIDGRVVNKYFAGTAVAELPFFLIAHGLSYVTGETTDGYSRLYPIFINIAGIFYLIFGLIFLRRILLQYDVSEGVCAFVLAVITFGTNLFYYSVVEPGMSHIYSFAFCCAFVYLAMRYFVSQKNLILLFILLALMVLIRPINVLILFSLPFLSGSKNAFIDGIRFALKEKWKILLGVALFCAILGIQSVFYWAATDKLWVYSYGNEGMNLFHPHFFEILFSYRKGLFLYTPVLLFSVLGFIYWFRNDRYLFWTLTAFLILVVYVLSSWWMWYYGGSFSGRVFVEYLPFFAIPIAVGLNSISRKVLKIPLIGALVVLTLFCQLQTYQYRYYLIHWSDMNQQKYWNVFLQWPK